MGIFYILDRIFIRHSFTYQYYANFNFFSYFHQRRWVEATTWQYFSTLLTTTIAYLFILYPLPRRI